MRIVAVDWSGRMRGAERAIWLAEVRDGRLVRLEDGRSRAEVVSELIAMARRDPAVVIGLDFAFGFPAWYSQVRGWSDARAVWSGVAAEGEAMLAACDPPFWGRPGRRNPNPGSTGLRETERDTTRAGFAPKSVFGVGGAGAVGTGSLRGMPHLLDLADAGMAVWPFDAPRRRKAVVMEIYPRLLTADLFGTKVVKSRADARTAVLGGLGLSRPHRASAAGSEDAFDAAVSALAMARHPVDLDRLARAPAGSPARIEGAIWRPGLSAGAG